MTFRPQDLLKTAEALARANAKKPTQAQLRRSISTAYYAMFHAVCATCANALLGNASPDRCERAWVQAYRSVEHKKCKEACNKCDEDRYAFPAEIRDFAKYFVTMQAKRHEADYDPTANFKRRTTVEYVEGARKAIERLEAADLKHRRAFAALVMLKIYSP